MTISETIAKLEIAFDLCNTQYFEGKLPKPCITIQSSPKFYGHCTTKKIWKSEKESWYEINMGAEFLNRPKEQLVATLIHEMVHLYCRENDIKETCQNGRYHNALFKAEAELRGLIIGYDTTIGYSPTTPSDALITFLKESKLELDIPFARDMKVKKAATRKPQYEYICPECRQSFKSAADLNVKCGICDCVMDQLGGE